ncbi:MAG: homogentisate 1,2-dioxygenase, partial [Burkholderiaceae bacterium]|nr:homogentisate 1,2-dioxygenase [Burkholderiaceae bacterium]
MKAQALKPDTAPHYQAGFANEFSSEALRGALPTHQNSPQRCPYGLYAEQISGTAFTAPRHANRRSWLYRIRPAAVHLPFVLIDKGSMTNQFDASPASPNQLRWNPRPIPAITDQAVDFSQSWFSMAGNGSAATQTGCAIHLYAANQDMTTRFFYNADAELLIIPQQGRLSIKTEMGVLDIEPQEIAVIPRGIRFQVQLPDGTANGYLCENFGALFRLPDLGVIGPNGLANPR